MDNGTCDMRPVRRALLSVSDKTGIVELAQELAALGVAILSTGGTARTLRDAGLEITDVSDHTGFPEMMEGRVKTLHPMIHGGILAKRNSADHTDAMEQHGIAPIDLVVINLYPFEETVAKRQAEAGIGKDAVSDADCIENIDIGGPAMIRSAAKNHGDVCVVVDPEDYATISAQLRQNHGALPHKTRRAMAAKAFATTAAYDRAIAEWFSPANATDEDSPFPAQLNLTLTNRQVLRYGENPHQQAAWYRLPGARFGLSAARKLQGKELSYNNLNDADAAWQLAGEFDGRAAVAIIKHANPCGVAVADAQDAAFHKALACDPTSAFGGIIACNQPLTAATAEAIGNLFLEVIIAPDFTTEALDILSRKKNLRLLAMGDHPAPSSKASWQVKALHGGVLVQEEDSTGWPETDSLRTVSKQAPDAGQLRDLQFAFTVAKHVKSNAIVLAKDGATIGIGAGQMSRVDSVRIAVRKAEDAGLSVRGAALASDAFFPFDDNVHHAAEFGVAALIQPGGSIRDEEVIAAADQHGIAMVLTGVRHFRH